MELLHIDQALPAQEGMSRSVKAIFGTITDFDELVETFVFYTPVVHHLIGDAGRITISTDIVSHTLAQVMQEHPLVITDLPRSVFRFDERIMAVSEMRSFCRTLYAVPREIWDRTLSHLRMLTVFDHATHRFCVLSLHERTIRNPIGSHAELTLPVRFFNCYGNRETLYFTNEDLAHLSEDSSISREPPTLCYHPPIREFVEIAARVLRSLQSRKGTPMEDAVRKTVEEMDDEQSMMRALAIQRENKLHAKIATPLKESSLSERYVRECHDIIRSYESVFGSNY